MVAFRRLESGQIAAVAGVAAVSCSVVGLQLGWMAAGVLGERDWLPAVLLATGGALGFWLGSRRNWFSGNA